MLKEFKHKNYVRISGYGDLLIPTKMLEQLVENAYIVRTDYQDGEDYIKSVEAIDKVNIHTVEELKAAAVQMALEGKE